MKPTNPIAQLQQWKKNNGKSNETQISAVKNATLLKNQERLKTQQEAQGEGKHKHQGKLFINPLIAEYKS